VIIARRKAVANFGGASDSKNSIEANEVARAISSVIAFIIAGQQSR
jgi:hypothetical protein